MYSMLLTKEMILLSHDNRKVQIVAVTLVDGFAFNVFPQLILMNIKIKLWRHIKFKTKC